MKPIPASAMQRPTCSGVMSILTPSDDSTSAAPERDDSARLPCLATGTPVPATMKDAQVDTLTDPEPSPPVPTTSTALAGALTFNIFARTAETAPVISSTVSPRTRSAINSPPSCEGVASPDIMRSKADAASSRESVAPVATLAMIDLRSSITCFQENATTGLPGIGAFVRGSVVACSGHLREGGFVDAGPDHRLQFGDVLGEQFIDLGALDSILHFLHAIGGKIDRRHRDVGDPEHDPAVRGRIGRLPRGILGGTKCGGDHARVQAGQGGVALETGSGLDVQSSLRRLVRELAALFKLLDHLRRLVAQPARNLIGAPSRFDLILDLIQAAFVRRGDADDIVPNIPAVIGNGVVVDADVAVEGLRNHIQPARNVCRRLSIGHAARPIYRLDGHGCQAKLLRGFDHACPATALVFHLVPQLSDLGARPLLCDVALDL